MQCIDAVRQDHCPQTSKEDFAAPVSPLILCPVTFRLHLNEKVVKTETNKELLKNMALEMINGNYTQTEWLHIYTDGSLTEANGIAGAGVYSEIFCFYKALGQYYSHFDGELEAINLALRQFLSVSKGHKKVVIFCDSTSAIQAIASFQTPQSACIHEIKSSIASITKAGTEIVLQWIPGHTGIHGNEMADFLAKKGTKISQTKCPKLSYISIKRLINNSFKKKFYDHLTTQGQGKTWLLLLEEKNALPKYPRRETVAAFRRITGHDCLAEHLHRIGILPSPKCVICEREDTIMNWEHLRNCERLQYCDGMSDGQLYWEVRRLMTMYQMSEH